MDNFIPFSSDKVACTATSSYIYYYLFVFGYLACFVFYLYSRADPEPRTVCLSPYVFQMNCSHSFPTTSNRTCNYNIVWRHKGSRSVEDRRGGMVGDADADYCILWPEGWKGPRGARQWRRALTGRDGTRRGFALQINAQRRRRSMDVFLLLYDAAPFSQFHWNSHWGSW